MKPEIEHIEFPESKEWLGKTMILPIQTYHSERGWNVSEALTFRVEFNGYSTNRYKRMFVYKTLKLTKHQRNFDRPKYYDPEKRKWIRCTCSECKEVHGNSQRDNKFEVLFEERKPK